MEKAYITKEEKKLIDKLHELYKDGKFYFESIECETGLDSHINCICIEYKYTYIHSYIHKLKINYNDTFMTFANCQEDRYYNYEDFVVCE